MKYINPYYTNSWKKLIKYFSYIKDKKIINFFNEDNNRFKNFSLNFKDSIIFDYSKNIIDKKTINIFINLLYELKLKDYIKYMFLGKNINITENKYVLNFLLRDVNNFFVKNNILLLKEKKKIDKNLEKIKNITNNILYGKWLGYSGEKIVNIVNIGIGGSDLGPRMIIKSLKLYHNSYINSYFVSNIDFQDINNVLKKVLPNNTIFIICSKTFTTEETIFNFKIARSWILNYFDNDKNSLNNHFIFVTSNLDKAKYFGLNKKNILIVSDWVGGRFSYCSAFGLSISLAIGFKNFLKLLKGAHDIDKHFYFSRFKNNIPIILSIISIWYNNFFNFNTELILVYNELLSLFPVYLQQLSMESNGKNVDRNNVLINKYNTCPILLGGLGTVCQHSFFQLLHQGTYITPCDFIIECCNDNLYNGNYKLFSNLLAQSQSLAFGNNIFNTNSNINNINNFLGNRPNNVFLIKKITPYIIGSLITIYEYKIFVQGIIWNICSYDQWGVELGKKLSKKLYLLLNNNKFNDEKIFIDNSTINLIKQFKIFNKKNK